MKVFCLTDPVVLLDSAFQFFYLPVNSCHVAYVERGYLPKAENSEIVQRPFEHFTDAERYRDDAEQSELLSDTLRLQLHDIQKNFADIEEQQHKTLKDARNGAVVPILSANNSTSTDVDNLQEIVGVGKVFERALNDLGIFSFRQIAAFNVGDMARVNREIKELKGRIEQDDWIGQAKDLHYLKYGVTD